MKNGMKKIMIAVALVLLSLSGCTSTRQTNSRTDTGASSESPRALNLGKQFAQSGSSTTNSLVQPPSWTLFEDPGLVKLLEQFDLENPNVEAALARVDQARARYGLSAVDKSPVLRGQGDATWRRDSENGFFVADPPDYEQFQLGLNLEYELDLWGRVRHSVEASYAEFEAEETEAIASLLPLRAQLVRTWYQLQALDIERRLLEQGIALREESLKLVDAQVRGGAATEVDLARARTELALTRVDTFEISRNTETLQNLLASLCGVVPAEFISPQALALESGPETDRLIPIPSAGLPADILRRRPDLVVAEKRLQAAHSRIGLAKASYLPKFSIGAGAGLSSLSLSDLFDVKSLFTSIGPDVTIPLYNGGRNKQDAVLAEAATREAYASYKALALNAVRQVEDALSKTRWLDQQIEALNTAVAAASETERLSTRRYDGGVASYLEVLDAQRTSLNARRQLAGIRAARRMALVDLVEALGGGWNASAE